MGRPRPIRTVTSVDPVDRAEVDRGWLEPPVPFPVARFSPDRPADVVAAIVREADDVCARFRIELERVSGTMPDLVRAHPGVCEFDSGQGLLLETDGALTAVIGHVRGTSAFVYCVRPFNGASARATVEVGDAFVLTALERGEWTLQYSVPPPLGWQPSAETRPHRAFGPADAVRVLRSQGIAIDEVDFYRGDGLLLTTRLLPDAGGDYWDLPVGPYRLEIWDSGALHTDDSVLTPLVGVLERLVDDGDARRRLLAGQSVAPEVLPASKAPAPVATGAIKRRPGPQLAPADDLWLVIEDERAVAVTLDELLGAVQRLRKRRAKQ